MANARIRMTSLVVEVPRIELGSDDIDQGLLRAQPLCRLLGYRNPRGPCGGQPKPLFGFPRDPVTGPVGEPSGDGLSSSTARLGIRTF